MKTIYFSVQFHKDSTHWVQVKVYPTRAVLRGQVTRLRDGVSAKQDAACFQFNNPGKNSCVSEIYLAMDFLTLENVVHESTHAAFQRATLIGLPSGTVVEQEQIATDAGAISDYIIAFLDQKKIAVRYGCVKRRMI